MPNKRIIFTKHAAERLLERGIPLKNLEKMLEKGLRIRDKRSGATLCVYKDKESLNKYYTLVIDEEADQIAIITGYASGKWQIEKYNEVRKK